jgi:hypothetical protein|tara:strand:- start:1041 stop:1346 length:306 start_codon:yes stop_codon:yes gene_type:complete
MEINNTFIYVSLILWQIGFIIGILLKLFYKPSGKKFLPTAVQQTVPAVEVVTPKNKPGHIDVEMKKNISLQKAKVSSVKSDEVIKGKVSTQKEKLKQLRRG